MYKVLIALLLTMSVARAEDEPKLGVFNTYSCKDGTQRCVEITVDEFNRMLNSAVNATIDAASNQCLKLIEEERKKICL